MEKTHDDAAELDLWHRAYTAAARFRDMAPWGFMDETDIFGVQDPVSGCLGFASVMGQLGEHFALGVYLSAEGLHGFWDARETDLRAYPEAVIEAPQVQMGFEDREMLAERDHAVIKKMGLRFRGRNAWPMFRSYEAGFVPWYLETSELRFLNVVLEQVLEVVPRFKADPGLFDTPDPGRYFLRVPGRRRDGIEWKDEVREIRRPKRRTRATAYGDLLEECDRLDRSAEAFEVDFFWLPSAVHEGDRPFYPYILMLVGAETGTVIGFRMLRVETSFEDMWAQLPRSLLGLFLETGVVPGAAYVRSPRLKRLIAPLGKKVPFTITTCDKLPALDQAKYSLIEAMSSPGEGPAGSRR